MDHPLRVALALFAAFCQAAMISGAVVHEASTVHVVCEDHGHILEFDALHDEQASPPDGLSAGEHDDHEHGCAFTSAAPAAEATAHAGVALPTAPPLVAGPSASVDAPRGPPLAFAPKTSPPSC